MFRFAILAAAITFAAGNSDALPHPSIKYPYSPQGRIVGGRETSIEEHPWQVSLQVLGFHFCGGSILSENLVLTAGHCTSYPTSWISARVASSTLGSGGSVHRVKEIVLHEDFRTNSYGIPENDMAVLKLKTPIQLSKGAQPIPLFLQDEEAPEGVLSTISGWGALSEGGSTPQTLQTVDVPIVNKIDCGKAYESWGGIPAGQICAAFPDGGKDTCQGDSGGPLVIAGRQAGIVSWGNGCAREGYPGVYTEIGFFRDWLVKNAGL